jgi:hypothetical protein
MKWLMSAVALLGIQQRSSATSGPHEGLGCRELQKTPRPWRGVPGAASFAWNKGSAYEGARAHRT